MKKSLFILVTIFSFFQSSATNVEGVISGNITWTKAGSPYNVIGHTLVDSTAILTIEPGVEVRVHKDLNFFIDGKIVAEGTSTNMIHFTELESNQYWRGLEFRNYNMSDTIAFKHCVISKVVKAILAYNTNILVDNCEFLNDSYYGIYYVNGGLIRVTNSKFSSCGTGVLIIGSGHAEIVNNEIYKTGRGVEANTGLGPNGIYLRMQDNNFHDNDHGAEVRTNISSDIKGNLFTNNKWGLGLSACNLDSPLRNNIFAFNEVGLQIGDKITGLATRNTFQENKVHVEIYQGLAGFDVHYNCFINCKEYNVRQQETFQAMDFSNNFWSVTDSISIHSKINVVFVGNVQTIIHYMPFLMQADASCVNVPPPSEISSPAIDKNGTNIKAYPNPFNSSFELKTDTDVTAVTISDLMGKKVLSIPVNDRKNITVDMQAFPAGIYIYQVAAENGTVYTGKITKR